MKHFLIKNKLTICGAGGGNNNSQQANPPAIISQYPSVITPPNAGGLNSISSFSYAEVIDLLSDGPIEGLINNNGVKLYDENIFEGIYLDDTQIKQSSNLIFQNFDISALSSQLKTLWKDQRKFTGTYQKIIDKGLLPQTGPIRFVDNVAIKLFDPSNSLVNFFNETNSDLSYKNSIQRAFDTSPISTQKLFLTEIVLNKIQLDLDKTIFDLSEGANFSDDFPLKLQIPNFGDYIYYSISADNLNQFNYFELPRSFVFNNSISPKGKKTFVKSLINKYNDAETYWTYEIFNVKILIWSIYDVSNGIVDFSTAVDNYLSTLTVSQNNGSLYNFNLVNAEFKNGSEYQLPLKNFNTVDIDTVYNKELVGPFKISNAVAKSDCGSYIAGGIQRLCSLQYFSNVSPPVNISLADETSDDIRYIKSWAVESDMNANVYLICCLYANYAVYDCTSANRSCQDAIPMTHYIANQNVESVYVSLVINQLSDIAATDMVAINPGFNSNKSASSTAPPFGTPSYSTLLNKFSNSSNGITSTGYFLIYGSSYNDGYVLDANTNISQLASNLTSVTTVNSALYLQTLSSIGLQSIFTSVNLTNYISANTYNASLQNGLVNYMMPNSTCLINPSFKINDYVSNLSSLQNRLQLLNDNGSLVYCFGLNEKETLVKSSTLTNCSSNSNISTILGNFNNALTSLGSVNKFYVASYLYNTYDIKISTNASNLSTNIILAVDIAPYIDFSLLFSSYSSANYSLPISSLSLKFDENLYPNVKKYIVDNFLSNSFNFAKKDNYYTFSSLKPPESYLPKLLLLGINYTTLVTNTVFNKTTLKFADTLQNKALDFIEYNLSNYLLKFSYGSYYKNFTNFKSEFSHLLTDSFESLLRNYCSNSIINSCTLIPREKSVYCLCLTCVTNAQYYVSPNSTNANLFDSSAKSNYLLISTPSVAASTIYVSNTYFTDRIQAISASNVIYSNADYAIYFGTIKNVNTNNLSKLDNNNAQFNVSINHTDGTPPTITPSGFSNCTVDITAGTKLPAIVSVRVETGYDSYDGQTYTAPCEYFSYKFDIFGISSSQAILDLGRNNYDYVYQQKESIDIGGYYTKSRPSYLQLPNIAPASTNNQNDALSQITSVTKKSTIITKFWTLKNKKTNDVVIVFNCLSSGGNNNLSLPPELSKDIRNINLACFLINNKIYLNNSITLNWLTTSTNWNWGIQAAPKTLDVRVGSIIKNFGSSYIPLNYYVDNQDGLNINNNENLNTYGGGAWDDFWNRAWTGKVSMINGAMYLGLCLNGFQDPGNRMIGSRACAYDHYYYYGPYDVGVPMAIGVTSGTVNVSASFYYAVCGGHIFDKFGAQFLVEYNDYLLCSNTANNFKNYAITHADPKTGQTQCLYWRGFKSKSGSAQETLKTFIGILKSNLLIDKSYTFAKFDINPSVKFNLAGSLPITKSYATGNWILWGRWMSSQNYAHLVLPDGSSSQYIDKDAFEVSYWEVPLTNEFAVDGRKLNDLYSNLYGTNKDLTIQLPPPKYDSFGNPIKRYVRVTKLSHETLSPLISKQLALNKVTEIVPHKFSYPFSSIVGLKIDSRAFSQVPNRTYLVKLKKVLVPSNYFPISAKSEDSTKSEVDVRYIKSFSNNYKLYDGDWDGLFKLAWTDNPAWVLMDLLVNKRYGLGNYISSDQIDIWELYKISRWCDHVTDDGIFVGVSDSKNGIQPRHTFNASLTQKFNLFDMINQVASIFHGRVYYANSLITFDDDRPKPAIGEFSNGDVKDGSFSYTNVKKSDQFTAVKISYIDSDDNFKPKSEYIEDEEGIRKRGVMTKEINAFGVNSKAQAIRFARNFLYQTSSENTNVTFVTDSRALLYRPGDLIRINDSLVNRVKNYGTIRCIVDIDSSMFELVVDQLIDPALMFSCEISLFTPINKPNSEYFSYLTKNSPSKLEINNLNYFDPSKNYLGDNRSWLACASDNNIFCIRRDNSYVKSYTGVVTYNYYLSQNDYSNNNPIKVQPFDAELCYSNDFNSWNLFLNNGSVTFNFDSQLDPQKKFNIPNKEYFFDYIDTGRVGSLIDSSSFAVSPACYAFKKKTINILENDSSNKLSYNNIIESDRPSVETFQILTDSIITGYITGINNDVMGYYSNFCVSKDGKASVSSGIGNITVGTPYSFTLIDTCERLFKIMSISENYINEYNIMANQYDLSKFNYIESSIASDDLSSTFNQLYNYNSPTKVEDSNAILAPQILSLERSSDLLSINITFYRVVGATSYSIYIQTPSKQTKNYTVTLEDSAYSSSDRIVWSYLIEDKEKGRNKEIGTYIIYIASVIKDSINTNLVRYSNMNQRSITLISY